MILLKKKNYIVIIFIIIIVSAVYYNYNIYQKRYFIVIEQNLLRINCKNKLTQLALLNLVF